MTFTHSMQKESCSSRLLFICEQSCCPQWKKLFSLLLPFSLSATSSLGAGTGLTGVNGCKKALLAPQGRRCFLPEKCVLASSSPSSNNCQKTFFALLPHSGFSPPPLFFAEPADYGSLPESGGEEVSGA